MAQTRRTSPSRRGLRHHSGTLYADDVDYGTVDELRSRDADPSRAKGDWGYYSREQALRDAGMPKGQVFSSEAAAQRYVNTVMRQEGISIPVTVMYHPGQATGMSGSRVLDDLSAGVIHISEGMLTEDILIHELAHIVYRYNKGKGASHGEGFAAVHARMLHQYMGISLRLFGARGGTWWRTHNKSRPFAPEHAYSVPMSDQRMYEDDLKKSPWYRPGYSAMDDPWHLWFYTVAMGWHADKLVQNDWVIEFSGREIDRADYDRALAEAPQSVRDRFWEDNRGLDGEWLILPDMRVINKISWSEFERLLLRTPLPPTPQGEARYNSHFDSWQKVADALVDRRAKGLDTGPVVDFLLDKFGKKKTSSVRRGEIIPAITFARESDTLPDNAWMYPNGMVLPVVNHRELGYGDSFEAGMIRLVLNPGSDLNIEVGGPITDRQFDAIRTIYATSGCRAIYIAANESGYNGISISGTTDIVHEVHPREIDGLLTRVNEGLAQKTAATRPANDYEQGPFRKIVAWEPTEPTMWGEPRLIERLECGHRGEYLLVKDYEKQLADQAEYGTLIRGLGPKTKRRCWGCSGALADIQKRREASAGEGWTIDGQPYFSGQWMEVRGLHIFDDDGPFACRRVVGPISDGFGWEVYVPIGFGPNSGKRLSGTAKTLDAAKEKALAATRKDDEANGRYLERQRQLLGSMRFTSSARGAQRLIDKAIETNTADAFALIHNVALGYDEIGSINDALDLDTVKMADVVEASAAIARQSQEALRQHLRDFEYSSTEEVTVYRVEGRERFGRGNSRRDGVVPVSLSSTLRFNGDRTSYRVKVSDVLTFAKKMNPYDSYVGEQELHVERRNLKEAPQRRIASGQVVQLGTPRLKYDYPGQVQRIGIIDPSAEPPKPGWTYFTHEPVEDWRSRRKREEWEAGNGTTKRKPAPKFQEGSGTADEGTVAFLDYIERPDEIFIAYMSVRDDQRRRGLAKKLVDWVYDLARSKGKARVNWGQVFYPANQLYWQYADKDMGVQTTGKPLDGRNASKTATRFSPSQMASWESTRPWALSVDDAKAQMVDGWWYRTTRGSEVASWEGGYIRPSEDFFSLPEETKRAIAYHEAGHAMIEAAGGLRALGDDPLAIMDLPGAQSLSYNAEEVLAEAYSVLWTEPEWFERMGAQKIRSMVIALAKSAGFPLPGNVKTAAVSIPVKDLRTIPDGYGSEGTVVHGTGYRVISGWQELITALNRRWYRSEGTYTVRGHEGETQFATELSDVLNWRGGGGRSGDFNPTAIIEVELDGLPFRSLTPASKAQPRGGGVSSMSFDTGSGVGIVGPIPLDRIKNVHVLDKGRITETLRGDAWKLRASQEHREMDWRGDMGEIYRGEAFIEWRSWRAWVCATKSGGQLHRFRNAGTGKPTACGKNGIDIEWNDAWFEPLIKVFPLGDEMASMRDWQSSRTDVTHPKTGKKLDKCPGCWDQFAEAMYGISKFVHNTTRKLPKVDSPEFADALAKHDRDLAAQYRMIRDPDFKIRASLHTAEATGDCYEAAGRYILDEVPAAEENAYRLCHGIVTGKGPSVAGMRFGHAWVEYTESGIVFVIDRSNGLHYTGLRDDYYRVGQIDPKDVVRYAPTEARVQMLRHQHWGPWDPRFDHVASLHTAVTWPESYISHDDRADTTGYWYHGSPSKFPPGTILSGVGPRRGVPMWSETYEREPDRADYVWVTDSIDAARDWAAKQGWLDEDAVHVYRVEPMDGPVRPYYDHQHSDGYIVPRARVVTEVEVFPRGLPVGELDPFTAMAVPDFKGRTKNLSDRQVLSACERIMKDIAREFGYTGALPDVVISPDLPGGTDGRSIDPSREFPNGAILLNEEFWLPNARDKESGYDAFRILAHEAIHALVQRGEKSYPGFSQMITEGGAEILAVYYWAKNAPTFDDRDAVRRDGKWVPGDIAMVARSNYGEWIVELMRRTASKVGWNREAIVREVQRVVAGDHNTKLAFRDGTNPDFAPPPGVKADHESLLLWLIEGVRKNAKVASTDLWYHWSHRGELGGNWVHAGTQRAAMDRRTDWHPQVGVLYTMRLTGPRLNTPETPIHDAMVNDLIDQFREWQTNRTEEAMEFWEAKWSNLLPHNLSEAQGRTFLANLRTVCEALDAGKRGAIFYVNDAEDAGSISAVAPLAQWQVVSSREASKTASANLWWRVHPDNRPFGPQDATSTPFSGGETQQGYSCFDNPWSLLVYLDAMQMYVQSQDQTVIAFTGQRVGTGNDGEALVVPDMARVERMPFAQFEDRLPSYPLPPQPLPSGWRGNLRSWSEFKRTVLPEWPEGAIRDAIEKTAQREGDSTMFGKYRLVYTQRDMGERKPRHVITAFDGDTVVGELNWYGTTGTIHHIQVEGDYLRQGIATAMWEWGQTMRPAPKHSGDRTTQGDAWARSVGGPIPRRSAASSNTIYRGYKIDFPKDIEETISRLVAGPTEESEIDQHYKLGPILIDFLASHHWESGVGLGRHWTTRREMAETAAYQGAARGAGVILEATYQPSDVNPDLTHTDKGWAETESEVNIKPGANLTITGVYLTDWYGWRKDWNLLNRTIRAQAKYIP